MGLGPIASQPLNSEQLELVKAQLSQLNSAQLNCGKLNSGHTDLKVDVIYICISRNCSYFSTSSFGKVCTKEGIS